MTVCVRSWAFPNMLVISAAAPKYGMSADDARHWTDGKQGYTEGMSHAGTLEWPTGDASRARLIQQHLVHHKVCPVLPNP